MSDPTILSLQILSYAMLFGMGFIIGRITNVPQPREIVRPTINPQLFNTQVFDEDYSSLGGTETPTVIPQRRETIKSQVQPKKTISIDESRVVVNVKTQELVRNGELGVKVESEDEVGSSVSKLASLKKNK